LGRSSRGKPRQHDAAPASETLFGSGHSSLITISIMFALVRAMTEAGPNRFAASKKIPLRMHASDAAPAGRLVAGASDLRPSAVWQLPGHWEPSDSGETQIGIAPGLVA
jgi:hypothetical protein